MNEQSGNSSGFSVRVDFERILETISSRIYDNQYAFLRENVQNAIDAIRIQAVRDSLPTNDPKYRVDIIVSGNTCSISDNGIGMTKRDLENNFWTMGASGKTTDEARKAGCIGVFGIGGFANFGVCETLEVISRSGACVRTHHTSLSRSAFKSEQFSLPKVQYVETDELSARGTTIRGTSKVPFDAAGLANYLKQFVKFVQEPIYIDGQKISQETISASSENKRQISEVVSGKNSNIEIQFQLFADDGNNLSAQINGLTLGGQTVQCKGYVRLVHGQLDVYKRGFRICGITIPSQIGVSGALDCDILQPTAGRDTLDSQSTSILSQIFQIVELNARPFILDDRDLLESHIRLLPTFLAQGQVEKLSLLPVSVLGNQQITLLEVRQASEQGKRVFYTYSGRSTSAAEVLQARGNLIVAISGNNQRRNVEIEYLRRFCKGEEFDNLIECLEPYQDLDSYDRAILTELDYAIRKLFKPADYRLTAGRLTLDAPIYWSSKKENGSTIVFVDTRHGEFQKLKPLGYTALFWSMIEAFCREYLGDTLKRQSPKFFGSGAVDLDSLSRTKAELWELLSSDIEISKLHQPAAQQVASQGPGRIEVVRREDIAQVTITRDSVATSPPPVASSGEPASRKKTPKLLQIIDEAGVTGLQGFYLRIPETAADAFGDIIRTFPSFAVVWFANRITWQGTDLKSTVFLFDITLDRLIGDLSKAELAHGALELGPSKVQTYNEQIYFFIPASIQDYIVPKSISDPVKIEIRHELLDLEKPRSWTSKEKPS